jgi:hypothetical protein
MQVVHADVKLIRDAFQFRLFLEREAAAVFAQEASDETLAQLRKEHELVLANFERTSRKGGRRHRCAHPSCPGPGFGPPQHGDDRSGASPLKPRQKVTEA